MQGFFTRIATTNLKIKPAEYQQIAADKSIEELERYLRERAETMSIEIPDIHAILHSTSYDQHMSSRCHEQWTPPKVSSRTDSSHLYKIIFLHFSN